jgi:hypothetical protein
MGEIHHWEEISRYAKTLYADLKVASATDPWLATLDSKELKAACVGAAMATALREYAEDRK